MRNVATAGGLHLLSNGKPKAVPQACRQPAPIVIGRGDRRYVLGSVISHGGMGTVYLGRMQGPMGFSKRVAIKSLRADHAKDSETREMFINEARLTAQLNHANIASTVDVLVEEDTVYIVMEYIDGSTVADLCKQARAVQHRIPVDIACAIAHDALLGLDHAHDARDEQLGELGIVHCDVSPQNVRIGTDGLSRILDFGIARAAQGFQTTTARSTKLHGKIPYMAPEQLQGGTVDRRADIYAAGVLLWEMLVGQRLFAGETPAGVVSQVLRGTIQRPSSIVRGIPPEVDDAVMRALSRDPSARFSSAAAMAARLSGFVASRRAVASLLKELSPSEFTPVSGIRTIAPCPKAPAVIDLPINPLFSGRVRALFAGLAILTLGGLGLAVGASRHATNASSASASAPAVRVEEPRLAPMLPTTAALPPLTPAPPLPLPTRIAQSKEGSASPGKPAKKERGSARH